MFEKMGEGCSASPQKGFDTGVKERPDPKGFEAPPKGFLGKPPKGFGNAPPKGFFPSEGILLSTQTDSRVDVILFSAFAEGAEGLMMFATAAASCRVKRFFVVGATLVLRFEVSAISTSPDA